MRIPAPVIAAGVIVAGLMVAPVAAMAEEWAAPAVDTEAPAKRVVKKKPKKAVVKKPVEAPAALPAAPIPYVALKPRLLLPATPDVPPPPPPPSESVAAYPAVVVAETRIEPPREITLKCDTHIRTGSKQATTGRFYLSLIPSGAFPDSGADFKVVSIDPDHKSIIRDSLCFRFRCNAVVSPTYYQLVDQSQKSGGYTKISLNRTTGAFFAQTSGSRQRLRLNASDVINETGTCRPEAATGPVLF